jgi:uncharacterized protein (TIGR00725 family)
METKLQIGVIGSAGEDRTETAEVMARELGKAIAEKGHVLVFGPELKPPSLSTIAAEEAKKNGGITLAVALGRGKTKFEGMDHASAWVYTDQSGGGGREVILANSCDGVIVLGGGVGTLIEIALSYTNLAPIVLMENTGGWADRLTESYLDSRKKTELYKASSVTEAIEYIETTTKERGLRTLDNH